MSARIGSKFEIRYERDGDIQTFPLDSDQPDEVTTTGDVKDALEFTIPIPATGAITVWVYGASKPHFTKLVIRPDGPVDVQVKLDKPTSATVFTALGTHINYDRMRVEESGLFELSGDQGLVLPNATAQNVEPFADLTTAVDGKVYEVKIRNVIGATVARLAKVWVVN